jgi:hypothetical protein
LSSRLLFLLSNLVPKLFVGFVFLEFSWVMIRPLCYVVFGFALMLCLSCDVKKDDDDEARGDKGFGKK